MDTKSATRRKIIEFPINTQSNFLVISRTGATMEAQILWGRSDEGGERNRGIRIAIPDSCREVDLGTLLLASDEQLMQ
jgi:hypothetical protein